MKQKAVLADTTLQDETENIKENLTKLMDSVYKTTCDMADILSTRMISSANIGFAIEIGGNQNVRATFEVVGIVGDDGTLSIVVSTDLLTRIKEQEEENEGKS